MLAGVEDFPYTEQLDGLFHPLSLADNRAHELTREKARNWDRKQHPSWLRIYAIRIEPNVYIVTGGAIKLTATMQEREHTQKELDKLGVIEVYKHNAINFNTYLEPGAPVITFGPALYSLLQEDDIYPNHVEQVVFGKSNFWFSKDLTTKGWWVYPATKFYDIVEGSASKIRDSYRTKLAALQLAKILNLGRLAPPRYPRLNKIFITSSEEFHEKFYLPNKDRHDEVLAWDLETSGLCFWKDRIGCITLSFDGVTGYYVPWKYVIKDELNEILGNNKQLGANIKFDVRFLWQNGVSKKNEEII